MGPRQKRVVQWAKITGCLLVALLSSRQHPFSASVGDVTPSSPANANRNTEQPQRLRTIQRLVEQTRKAWKEVHHLNQQMLDKAKGKTREILRKARHDPKALGRKAFEDIQQIWSDAQEEIQRARAKALREAKEIWENILEKVEEHDKTKISQKLELDLQKTETPNEALVFVVPGTDARVPFTDVGANPHWLEHSIKNIVKDNKRQRVKNFYYNQPWFPGLCSNRMGKCYQTNVRNLSEALLKEFETCCKNRKVDFKVVAHSYGVAITYDALKMLDQEPHARNIGFRVSRLVTLSPPLLILYYTWPSNVAVWKNIHGGFGYIDRIGDANNILVNVMKKFDHSAMLVDERGREAIRTALVP